MCVCVQYYSSRPQVATEAAARRRIGRRAAQRVALDRDDDEALPAAAAADLSAL